MKTLIEITKQYETNFDPSHCDLLGTVSDQCKAWVNEQFSCQIMPVRDKWVAWVYDGEESVAYVSLKDTYSEVCGAAYNLRNEYVEAAMQGVYTAAVNETMSMQHEIACAPSIDSYR